MDRLKTTLERAYQDFHSGYRREQDPVGLVHRYPDNADREVAGFIAALLAYGNVATILKSVGTILECLGPTPKKTLQEGNGALLVPPLFKHRFTTAMDMEILFSWMSSALHSHGSLENFFGESQRKTLRERLSQFVVRFCSQPLSTSLAKKAKARERQLKYLISDPQRGSACKRLNLYLRWMVRPDDGIDFGLWKTLSPKDLILPIDTHILQTLKKLGWAKTTTANWRMAEAATARLRNYSPEDPLRYDFSLCHLSMSGNSISDYLKAVRGA